MHKTGKLVLILVPAVLLICAVIPADVLYLKQFPFDDKDDLNRWREVIIDGKVDYFIDLEGENGFVHADSRNNCSAIYYRVGFNLKKYSILSWRWRVLKFPKKEMQEDPPIDDYAVRVYVVFPSIFFSMSKFIEYIWSEHLPEGHIQVSPSGKNIRQIVVRSGRGNAEEWFEEERNMYEDYQKAFGKKVYRPAGAIAIMCNSNLTKSEAEALVDNITIGTKAKVKWRLGEDD